MGDPGDRFSEELEALRGVCDEFRVQMELGRAEAHERWEKLERDWHRLEGKLKLLRTESRAELKEVGGAARVLVREIREGFRHLRSLL